MYNTFCKSSLYREYYRHVNIEQCASIIVNQMGNRKKVMFTCIGTDRATGDAYGPLLGTELKKRGYMVEGTLDDPIHAINCNYRNKLIKNIYSDYFIIAIDSCQTCKDELGFIYIENEPIKPASTRDMALETIGDISIKFSTACEISTNTDGLFGVRLYDTIKYVETTLQIIDKTFELIDNKRKVVSLLLSMII